MFGKELGIDFAGFRLGGVRDPGNLFMRSGISNGLAFVNSGEVTAFESECN